MRLGHGQRCFAASAGDECDPDDILVLRGCDGPCCGLLFGSKLKNQKKKKKKKELVRMERRNKRGERRKEWHKHKHRHSHNQFVAPPWILQIGEIVIKLIIAMKQAPIAIMAHSPCHFPLLLPLQRCHPSIIHRPSIVHPPSSLTSTEQYLHRTPNTVHLGTPCVPVPLSSSPTA